MSLDLSEFMAMETQHDYVCPMKISFPAFDFFVGVYERAYNITGKTYINHNLTNVAGEACKCFTLPGLVKHTYINKLDVKS